MKSFKVIGRSDLNPICYRVQIIYMGWIQTLFRERVKSQSLENWTLNSESKMLKFVFIEIEKP